MQCYTTNWLALNDTDSDKHSRYCATNVRVLVFIHSFGFGELIKSYEPKTKNLICIVWIGLTNAWTNDTDIRPIKECYDYIVFQSLPRPDTISRRLDVSRMTFLSIYNLHNWLALLSRSWQSAWTLRLTVTDWSREYPKWSLMLQFTQALTLHVDILAVSASWEKVWTLCSALLR